MPFQDLRPEASLESREAAQADRSASAEAAYSRRVINHSWRKTWEYSGLNTIAMVAGALVAFVTGAATSNVFYGVLTFIATMMFVFLFHLFVLSPQDLDKAKQEEIKGLREEIALLQDRVRNAEPRIKETVRHVYFDTGPMSHAGDNMNVILYFLIEVSLRNDSRTPTTLLHFRLEVDNEKHHTAEPTSIEHLTRRRYEFMAAPYQDLTKTFEDKVFALESNLVLSSDNPQQGWLGFALADQPSKSVRSITLKIEHSYGTHPIVLTPPFSPVWDSIVYKGENEDKKER